MENVSGIAFGISIFSIMITVFAFIAFIVFLIWILKKKREPKGSRLFWPYLFLILILIAILVANNRTEYEAVSEISMQNIMDDANLLLKDVHNKIEDVPLVDLSKKSTDKWFDEKFISAELKQDSYREIKFDETIAEINKFVKIIHRGITICEEMNKFMYRKDELAAGGKLCKFFNEYLVDEIIAVDRLVEKTLKDQFGIVDQMKGRINAVCDAVEQDVEIMKLKNFGVEKIETDLNKRKTMLLTFQSAINNTENIRRDWVNKLTETLPDKQTILKSLIIKTSLANMLLSAITIVIILCSKHLPQIVLSIGMSFMIVITGLMTIGLSGYTIILYFQFQTTCPLNNNNFGLSNFTSSIPENDRLCQNVNGTFYESLTSEMMQFPKIVQDYNIQQYIDKTKKKAVDVMEQFPFPGEALSKTLGGTMENTDKIVNATHEKETNICAGYPDTVKTGNKFRTDRIAYIQEVESFKYVLEKYNEYVETFPNILMVIFEKPYRSLMKSYKEAVNRIQTKTNATDFPCQLIFDKYSDAGNTICGPFHGKVPLLWIYLIVIILSFTASLIVHVLVLRNLKSGKKNAKLEEQQSPSPSTPPTH